MTAIALHGAEESLTAWREAASTGGFPAPTRDRWQQLRGGVVNMWEYDVEEYWLADGRAQFVGANETGKSSLMTLTSLILLAGSLERGYIDTLGGSQKSFRYYLEPTDTVGERRDLGSHTNRGWVWAEFGRLVDGEPEYLTLLLFAQAKRGVTDLTREWLTCHGQARVRDGIVLARGRAVLKPTELGEIASLSSHANGAAYRAAVAATLFGFTDPSRIDSALGMLKVLRTPHLGQKLDPDFFTSQMREALPPVARDEIDQLATGWDELDRLARDRDFTAQARDAVRAYVRTAWNPWADAVLRRAADDVAAAVTRFDDLTRVHRTATADLEAAQRDLADLEQQREDADADATRLEASYETLLASAAYRDAQAATDRVQVLAERHRDALRHAEDLRGHAEQARRTADRTAAHAATTKAALTKATIALEAAVATCRAVVEEAGLGEAAVTWVDQVDVDRLRAGIGQRRSAINATRKLIAARDRAETALAQATERLTDREADQRDRETAATGARTELEAALQQISDDLETWTAGLAALDDPGPTTTHREAWVGAVVDAATSEHPRAVLATLVHTDWAAPTIDPLTAAAAVADADAETLESRSAERSAEADAAEAQHDPVPDAPTGWTRRARPERGEHGAPLWALLDPREDLPATDLDTLEAALAAAGVLDAWVTPDGAWLPERDGDDVLAVTARPPHAGPTLRTKLRPAADAGPLTGSVAALLDAVGYLRADQALTGELCVAADGRFRTPVSQGRAGASAEGAALIGTAARVAARARRVAQLRAEAADLTTQAERRRKEATGLRRRVEAVRAAQAAAPNDSRVVARAAELTAAQRELTRAVAVTAKAAEDAAAAEQVANDARAALHTFAADHQLPVDETLSEVSAALERAAEQVTDLHDANREVRHAEQRHQEAARRATEDGGTAQEREAAALAAHAAAQRLATEHETAKDALGATEQEMLERADQLRTDRDAARRRRDGLAKQTTNRAAAVSTAEATLDRIGRDRDAAEATRAEAVRAWWVPVDAGLAAARGVSDPASRTLTGAVDQARAARASLHPQRWPEHDRSAVDGFVNRALTKAAGPALGELNVVLEASGGRTATVTESEDPAALTEVSVLVDASGATVSPTAAIRVLDEKVAELEQMHDAKMHAVLEELLSSTFVDHMRDRMTTVVRLLGQINTVLAAHPTGTTRTVRRLTRVGAEGHKDGYAVLTALVEGAVDSPQVQEQVKQFLERRIAEAQQVAAETGGNWQDHLADLLDYRRWFDVVTEFRDETRSRWQPLTRKEYGQASGGAQVIALLQPLLATLVALYDESPVAPRPLWLDEAFTGVDGANRSSMLNLFVEFDLDFLLAGPGTLVTAAQVPAAAVWYVNRAPFPAPGVALSCMLWAGRTQVPIGWRSPDFTDNGKPSESADAAGPDGIGQTEDGLWS